MGIIFVIIADTDASAGHALAIKSWTTTTGYVVGIYIAGINALA
jgi:hypothetical protein